jgi:hypothetical protein
MRSRRWIAREPDGCCSPVLLVAAGRGRGAASRGCMVDEDAQHLLAVTAVEDQQPVETFGADGADEPLGDRVRLRSSHRRLDDPDALASEDLIERAAVLAVAITDQEPEAALAEVQTKVARLLDHPVARGIPGAAREPDSATRVRDEEEHLEAA